MKKFIAIFALGALVVTCAFAELTLGISGAQYYMENSNGNLPSLQDAWKNFREGTGVYYGGFAEILGRHWGLGLAFNYTPTGGIYDQYYYGGTLSLDDFQTMSYDVNLYLSYHLFGGAAFLDPFVEAGFGITAFAYLNKDKLNKDTAIAPYIDDNDPLFASSYTTVGLGLGLNLKPIGVFFKANWCKEGKSPVKGTYDSDYYDPNKAGEEYYIDQWFVMPFRWTFGAKLILF